MITPIEVMAFWIGMFFPAPPVRRGPAEIIHIDAARRARRKRKIIRSIRGD